MSLDIQYRPKCYEDVVGQDGTIKVLRQIVKSDKGFQQSYMFSGSHGSGKTTTARIFARSLLCHSPVEGQGCGHCESCTNFDKGTSSNYIEIDAATNSGKADMKRIVESLAFASFSGNRTIYCMDESHQLSKDALDALLKPMEDPIRGSEDKQLVCIFCTTEPEKMRSTILSRCAPAFTIRKPEVPAIVDRLKYVADQESIPYDEPSLIALVEATKSHMRDALKALGSVASIGGATKENVEEYLGLGNQHLYFDILESVGVSLAKVAESVDTLSKSVSPTSIYDNLMEIVMVAHRIHLGINTIPSYMPKDRVVSIAHAHEDFLVNIGQKLADRVNRPTKNMVICDLSVLHHQKSGTLPTYVPTHMSAPPKGNLSPSSTQSKIIPQSQVDMSVDIGEKDGVYAPRKATKLFAPVAESQTVEENGHLIETVFFQLLKKRVDEIQHAKNSSQKTMGST